MRSVIWLLLLLMPTLPALADGQIALVQYTANDHFGERDINLRALARYADEAVTQDATIILFPEGSTWGYQEQGGRTWHRQPPSTAHYKDVAETLEEVPRGPTTRYWTEYSRHHQVYAVFFVIEKAAEQIYRTAVVTGPKGYIGKYRKRHLWKNEELLGVTPGTEDFILDTPWGRFGLLICYDIWFGHVEEYKAKGVDAIFLLSDWSGPPGSASTNFHKFAKEYAIDFYAVDDHYTDGTGYYPAGGAVRYRPGLKDGRDGVALIPLRH